MNCSGLAAVDPQTLKLFIFHVSYLKYNSGSVELLPLMPTFCHSDDCVLNLSPSDAHSAKLLIFKHSVSFEFKNSCITDKHTNTYKYLNVIR